MSDEEWRDAVGFEGVYEISSLGNVRNKKRKTIVKCFPNNKGYIFARLSVSGKYKNKAVHRMVAEAFLNISPEHPVNHMDGNKKNNNIANLEQSSTRENTTHFYGRKRLTGAYYHKKTGRWRSSIRIDGKAVHLGVFSTAEEAHQRYLGAMEGFNIKNKYAVSYRKDHPND